MPTHRVPRSLLIGVLVLPLLIACGDPRLLEPTHVILSGDSLQTSRMDPVELLRAEIGTDTLRVQLRYGGGCRQHIFSLHYTSVFRESMPVQTGLWLAHDARGDPCRALITREIAFDLTPLRRSYERAYGGGGTLIVHLYTPRVEPGEAVQIRYDF